MLCGGNATNVTRRQLGGGGAAPAVDCSGAGAHRRLAGTGVSLEVEYGYNQWEFHFALGAMFLFGWTCTLLQSLVSKPYNSSAASILSLSLYSILAPIMALSLYYGVLVVLLPTKKKQLTDATPDESLFAGTPSSKDCCSTADHDQGLCRPRRHASFSAVPARRDRVTQRTPLPFQFFSGLLCW